MLLRHTMSRPIMVPLLLDEDRFKQVQEVLAQTSQVFRGRDHCYPLSLRIYGLCGARYHGVFRRDISTRFYSCNNKRWENRDTRCDDAVIRADDIEVVVWEQVCDLLSRPERLVALAEGYLGLRGQQIEVERDEYEEATKKVAELDRAIKNLLVTSARAGLAPADIESAVLDLTRERDTLSRHLAMIEGWRAESQHTSSKMRRLWELAEQAHQRLPNMTHQEQKQVLELLDVRVTVIKHARKTARHRILEPAQIRIEGVVNDQVLLSADETTRHIAQPPPLQ